MGGLLSSEPLHSTVYGNAQPAMVDPRSPMPDPRSPIPQRGYPVALDPRSPMVGRSPVPVVFDPMDPRSPMMHRSPMGVVGPISPSFVQKIQAQVTAQQSPSKVPMAYTITDSLKASYLSPCCPSALHIPGLSPLSPAPNSNPNSPTKESRRKSLPSARARPSSSKRSKRKSYSPAMYDKENSQAA
eukprot:TRINITY_DN60181_c0_g1_i1.p1 TRINITY_DN60181_c0_g1~~TRINITY_DN60181_c0_g1_i1.p1  ORF type:complete len:186 (-),score=30.68 TRINITY_DN60181_c0_g1_i1:478-1035(-)